MPFLQLGYKWGGKISKAPTLAIPKFLMVGSIQKMPVPSISVPLKLFIDIDGSLAFEMKYVGY